jgi:hypothetical protein
MGDNDITIIYGILLFLMLVGFCLPYIQEVFTTTMTSTVNGTALEGDLITVYPANCSDYYAQFAYSYGLTPPIDEPTARAWGLPPCTPGENVYGKVSIWSAIMSMLGMLVWSFGGLPFWIDLLIFMPLRIVVILLIARNVWIGGGG